MIWLSADFRRRLTRPWEGVEDAFEVSGRVFREPAGARRRTLRFELAGNGYFLKLHWGVGWREIFKNLFSGRLPVLGARNEWEAIRHLEAIGVETLHLEAYGEKGWNPAHRRSFVVTRELTGCVSLEEYCSDWGQRPPPPVHKWRLIERVAKMTRVLHSNGLNHRDLYICHFLLDQPWSGREEELHLYLIDLHRMQRRRRVPRRWKVKDLGSLWFSTLEIGLTRRDRLRFLRVYFGLPVREILERERRLLEAVEKRMHALEGKKVPDG
ncbi:MAG TPA: lipopolysaccharide core heptose(I) kinase RfaP [Chromatiaceae bacterium]|nr:lipopolysaccharide core heptose(I) kinase RfaP [Chromatiaceae bacterium]